MVLSSKIVQANYNSVYTNYQKNIASKPILLADQNSNNKDQFVSSNSNRNKKQQVPFTGADWIPVAVVGLMPLVKECVTYFTMDYIAILRACKRVDKEHHKYLLDFEKNNVVSSFFDHGAHHLKEETEKVYESLHGGLNAVNNLIKELQPDGNKPDGLLGKSVKKAKKIFKIQEKDEKKTKLEVLQDAATEFKSLINASTKGLFCEDISEATKNKNLSKSGPAVIAETSQQVREYLKLVGRSLIDKTETDTYKESLNDIRPINDAMKRIEREVTSVFKLGKEQNTHQLTLVKPADKVPKAVEGSIIS